MLVSKWIGLAYFIIRAKMARVCRLLSFFLSSTLVQRVEDLKQKIKNDAKRPQNFSSVVWMMKKSIAKLTRLCLGSEPGKKISCPSEATCSSSIIFFLASK